MQHPNADERLAARPSWQKCLIYGTLSLAAFGGVVHQAFAAGAAAYKSASSSQSAGQLSIQVNDDRMTLAMAKVPQIYLYGVIDAGAPQRFAALVSAGKIPNGSDIYLNSTDGDVAAGLALGRLFRRGTMTTHLGTPRARSPMSVVAKTATCSGACAYAYLGGLYRWAPAGSDRIGFSMHYAGDTKTADTNPSQQPADDVVSYLKEMDIKPSVLAQASDASRESVVWFNPDQMIATGLANNGRLFLKATYRYEGGFPFLELKQTDRSGDHSITMQCKPGSVILTAYSTIGANRASQIVSRGIRSYFEVNQQPLLPEEGQGVTLQDQSVVIARTYPPGQLWNLISAQALGAWVGDRNGAVRYGFAFEVTGVKDTLKNFYEGCWQAAPWSKG